MRIIGVQEQILPTFNVTVTIINRQRATPPTQPYDTWHKTVIANCAYTCAQIASASGNTLNLAAQHVLRVPKSDAYMECQEWAKNPARGFTLALGDIVVVGEIEELQIANASALLAKYQSRAFMIKTFTDNTRLGLVPHYCVRGG